MPMARTRPSCPSARPRALTLTRTGPTLACMPLRHAPAFALVGSLPSLILGLVLLAPYAAAIDNPANPTPEQREMMRAEGEHRPPFAILMVMTDPTTHYHPVSADIRIEDGAPVWDVGISGPCG